MSSNYWSSTTNANNSTNAWQVNFNNGNVNNNNKSNAYYVRAVRGGKCSLLSFESVYRAYLDCRKRKRGTINALRFEYHLIDNLFDLTLALQKGTYQPSRSVCFITTTPKLREIFAADFGDRIVHHLVVRDLEKVFEPRFIYDSYASRKGKGTHAAIKRLQGFMLRVTKNRKLPAYFLKLDIRSFFMSIDKDILFSILERFLPSKMNIEYEVLLYLIHRVIFHNCTDDYLFKGDPAMLDKIPPHKTLFKMPPEKGLPIGNLTSQFFANVYLNELDQYIKHTLKCPFYIRYVDDLILLSQSREELIAWEEEIEAYSQNELALDIKPHFELKRLNCGADFLGYIVRPSYILARKRVVNNLKYKLAQFKKRMVIPCRFSEVYAARFIMIPKEVFQLKQTISSYLGHFRHADTFRLINSLFIKQPWLLEYFIYHKERLFNRFRHKGTFRSFYAQLHFFKYRLPETILFVKVGRYFEVYNEDALFVAPSLKLTIREDFRGMQYVVGFPVWLKARYIASTISLGRDVAILYEGIKGRFIRERYVREIYRTVKEESGLQENP